MSKESPTPMAADKSGTEAIFLGREVGGDKEKGVDWDTIDANEGVLPLANSRKCSNNILLEPRNRIRAVTAEEISISLSSESRPPFYNVRRRRCHSFQHLLQSKGEFRKRQAFSGVDGCIHRDVRGRQSTGNGA